MDRVDSLCLDMNIDEAKPRASFEPPFHNCSGPGSFFLSLTELSWGKLFDIRNQGRESAFYTGLKTSSTPSNKHSFVTDRGRPEPLIPTAPAISRLSCLASDELFPAIPTKNYRPYQMVEAVRVLRTEYTVPSPLR